MTALYKMGQRVRARGCISQYPQGDVTEGAVVAVLQDLREIHYMVAHDPNTGGPWPWWAEREIEAVVQEDKA